jgi:cytochrome P450
MTRILEYRNENNVSDIQIAAHASDLVLAGSETTATALSCITYYLLHTPHALKVLREEIDKAFKSYDEINAMSTSSLKYLQAVCLEGMRIYSPLPFALPRVVPPGGDTVDGHFLPAGVSQNFSSFLGGEMANNYMKTIVSTNPVAASLDARNFKDPLSFKPERWLNSNKTDKLDASQPFSLGSRGCLGKRYVFV